MAGGKFTLEDILAKRRQSRNHRTVECNSEDGEGDEPEAGEGGGEVGDEGDSQDGSGHEEGAASS